MIKKTLKPFEKRKDFKDVKKLLKNRKVSDFVELKHKSESKSI